MLNQELPSLNPINFFEVSLPCHYLDPEVMKKGATSILGFAESARSAKSQGLIDDNQKYQLPNLSRLSSEEVFASVRMGWNEEGLSFLFCVDKELEKSIYPEIRKGDSVELFIDTRDVKTSGYNTRFCHHFFVLPESVQGKQVGEMTRFRTEDAHDLCDSSELQVRCVETKGGFNIEIFIPKSCLHGYDPEQCPRIGFTYRINRPRLGSQNFSVSDSEYHYEQQPSLWPSLRLVT